MCSVESACIPACCKFEVQAIIIPILYIFSWFIIHFYKTSKGRWIRYRVRAKLVRLPGGSGWIIGVGRATVWPSGLHFAPTLLLSIFTLYCLPSLSSFNLTVHMRKCSTFSVAVLDMEHAFFALLGQTLILLASAAVPMY